MFHDLIWSSVQPAFRNLIVSGGGVISAGIFAFLAIIGIFPRLIHYTGTKRSILLYETLLILGGTTGNILDLYHVPIAGTGTAALIVWGLFSGSLWGVLSCHWQKP